MEIEEIESKIYYSDGTTALETYIAIFPVVLLTFITTTISSIFVIRTYIIHFVLEFTLIVIPLILYMTVLVPFLNEVIFTLICISICILMIQQENREKHSTKQSVNECCKLNYITNARSAINIMSVIAILAVDFNIFPRKFTKTIQTGYSLMDTGVGLFIFSNGIVASEVRKKVTSIKDSFKKSLPLFILGAARVLLVKQIDYHVPVSEYGVHWNFFVTLAFTKLFSSLILYIVPVHHAVITATAFLLVHEIGLQLGLAEFALSEIDRNTFFRANREGIISVPGYLGLYFLSVAFGDFLDIRNKYHMKKKLKLGVKLLACSVIFLWATLLLDKNFGVSRRIANCGYCAWIMFIGISMTGFFFISEQIQFYIYKATDRSFTFVPVIFEAINYNGLMFFLLANLLTGFVNVLLDTFSVNATFSLIILSLYMLINCATVGMMYCKGIKLKV